MLRIKTPEEVVQKFYDERIIQNNDGSRTLRSASWDDTLLLISTIRGLRQQIQDTKKVVRTATRILNRIQPGL
jgi:hypothetical protein